MKICLKLRQGGGWTYGYDCAYDRLNDACNDANNAQDGSGNDGYYSSLHIKYSHIKI